MEILYMYMYFIDFFSFIIGCFDDFWSVNEKFMLNTKGEAETFKHFPFCIYKVLLPVGIIIN